MPDKVLHVSESDEWSGGAAQLLALAEGLRAGGWSVRIACRPGSGLAQHAGRASFETFTVALSEDYDLFSAWKLAGLIRRHAIQVVHAHHNRSHAVCLLAKLLLKLTGGPAPVLVVSRRVSFPPGRNPFSRWKYQSGLIDRIVAVAEAVKEVLVSSGVDPKRVAVIRSGVELARFSPRPPDEGVRKELGLPDGTPVIGKIANASPWKGQTVLLEAAARLVKKGRRAHFLLAGRDTDAEWVRNEVSRRGLEGKVTLAGFRTDVPEVISCLSVSVNAAVKGEGLSGALRESLAMGIPVVASDIAGNRELLGSGAAPFLFKPGDAEALAQRLEWALDHPSEARASAESWRKKAPAEFSLESTIEKTAALYRSLLDGR